MKDDSSKPAVLPRRDVVAAAAAAGVGGLLFPAAAMAADAVTPDMTGLPDTTTSSAPNVSHWGAYTGEVMGGKLVSVQPFAGDKYPVPLIQAMPDLLYSPTRIQAPMVREGFLKKRSKSDRTGRGREPFVQVSWDEATKIVAEELGRVKKQYGNRAIYAGSYGWQSAGTFHTATGAMQRLMALLGGYVFYVNTYSAPVLPVITPHVLGDARPRASAWPTILKNAKLIVFMGFNPMISDEIIYGGDGQHYDFKWLKELKNSGIPVVSVNPIDEDTDEYLGTERITLRPNTDTAFMLGIAHVLYTEKLHDQAFLDKYTVGFAKFADYLTGKADGTPKTAEWAAAITEVSADTIRTLARRMAKNRTMLMGGFSLQRAEHGEQPVWMMITLSAMLGHFGSAGGGAQINFPPELGNPMGSGPHVAGLPAIKNPVKDFVPVNMWADLLLNPGKTIDYDGRKIKYPDIKLVYWTGGNPFHHGQDTNRVLKAWQRPEVTIVHDYNWTATAKHADIVLPATTAMERNDITSSGNFILAMRQIVPPQFEARSDYDICASIADRLGLKDKYTEGKDEMTWLRELYATAAKQGKAKGLEVPEFDAFWEKGSVEFPTPKSADESVAYSDFIEDPDTNALGTPSGKIEIFSDRIASFHYDDCPGHPTWLPPSEWLGSPKAKKFPLHVISAHPKYRLHSQLDNTFLRDWYEVNEREPVWINPKDAKARGIQTGDVVRVFNDRGQTLAGALVSTRVREGVIKLHEGAWYDPVQAGRAGSLDKHGNVNMLTTDKGSSKLAQGNPSHTCLAQLEKYNGALPAVTAFTPPRTLRKG